MTSKNIPKPWMVFNVGCIDCGVSSNVVGFYATEDEAYRIVDFLDDHLSWRGGGQNSFEVFDITKAMATEYVEALKAMGA